MRVLSSYDTVINLQRAMSACKQIHVHKKEKSLCADIVAIQIRPFDSEFVTRGNHCACRAAYQMRGFFENKQLMDDISDLIKVKIPQQCLGPAVINHVTVIILSCNVHQLIF